MNSEIVQYRIVPHRPGAHLFEVTCTVQRPDPAGQRFAMPAWIPGSYLIRDFSRNVVRLSAKAGGVSVAVTKTDKSTWLCAPVPGPLSVTYEVYAHDLSVRGAHLDTTHAYFNGPAVFLAVCGREAVPCSVVLERPPAGIGDGWRVATSMTSTGADGDGFGAYAASCYDELIDHPVEIGNFTLIEFSAGGVQHRMAITGRHHADGERLQRDLARVCQQHIDFFGATPPFDRYLFLVTVLGRGYGGLEHRWSSSLVCSRDELPGAADSGMARGYRRFLGLVSHEYFHLWNVKRIKPAVFTPYALDRESHTTLLWVFEGITSYYDDMALVRSGLITTSGYLQLLEETANRVYQVPGRRHQSLAESSFDAWTKLYKADENAPNAIVSYYTKGALAALALDLTIRRDSDGARSLDEVMRAFWERYGASEAGVSEDGFERLAAEVSGLDLARFFDAAVRGTNDLPLAELLASVGLRFELGPSTTRAADAGGAYYHPNAGLRTRSVQGRTVVQNVLDGGAAQEAGLSAQDELIALNGLRVVPDSLGEQLAGFASGERIAVDAFRRDELVRFELSLLPPPADTCQIHLVDDVDADILSRRHAWLSGRSA